MRPDPSVPPRPLSETDFENLRVLVQDCIVVIDRTQNTAEIRDAANLKVEVFGFDIETARRYIRKEWISNFAVEVGTSPGSNTASYRLSDHGRQCIETGSDLPCDTAEVEA